MSDQETRERVIGYWIEKALEALQSAKSELEAKRLSFAVNRAYYACFYSASALLMRRKERFKKHSGVRAAVHRTLVKTGELDTSWGRFYDYVFENRQRGDYQELVDFEADQVEEMVGLAEGFVREIQTLLDVSL